MDKKSYQNSIYNTSSQNYLFLKVFFNKPCLKNCKICPYIFQSSFLKQDKAVLPFFSNGNCESKGLVYIILFVKCRLFFIGETARPLKDRISQHLNQTICTIF